LALPELASAVVLRGAVGHTVCLCSARRRTRRRSAGGDDQRAQEHGRGATRRGDELAPNLLASGSQPFGRV